LNFGKWIRQPSTIDGLGWLLGVAGYGVAHVITREETASVAIATVLKGAVHLVINDASAEAPVDTSIETFVRDAVTAEAQRKLNAALPALTGDILQLLTTGRAALAGAPIAAATAAATAGPVQTAAPATAPAAVTA